MQYLFHVLRCSTIIARRALSVVLLASFFAVPLTAQDAYRLSPGDQIGVRIVAWDTIALEFVEYGALNGEYAIGQDGTITLPLLGPVEAAGKSPTELSEEMTVQLQGRLGLVEQPSISVSIASYRPIYVLGAVRQPGTYPFSPGLTVQQALALAGGIDTLFDEGPDQLAATIRAAGTLRELRIDLAREQIRARRLKAEMDDLEDFGPPAAADHPDGAEAINAILAHERTLFQSRREVQERALVALEASQALLETEVSALEEKLAGQNRQVGLLRKQVGNVESLVERGLARSPSFISAQNQLIDLENRQLDTETAIFRARQFIAELERDRVEIEAARRLEILRELQRAEAEIERLTARRNTTSQLLAGAEAVLAEAGETPDFQLLFEITREDGTDRTDFAAELGTRVRPADVLDVQALVVEETVD